MYTQVTLIYIITTLLLLRGYSATGYLDEMGQCEPIKIEMCRHLKYNMTRMPNILGHTSQEEAIRELTQYSQLVSIFNCSQHINFFLCSIFLPMCTQQLDGPLVIQVCKSMCLQVKSDCEPKLANLNLPWRLNCSQLPGSTSKEQLCMAPEVIPPSPQQPNPNWGNIHFTPIVVPPDNTEEVTKAPSPLKEDTCPKKYVRYDNSTCTNLCDPKCLDCVPKCEEVYYTKGHKSFAYAWIAPWASLCLLSTLLTISTFCVDPDRFRYPTRPVMFMAFCYLMYALAHFIRLSIPAEDIACKQTTDNSSLLIVNGMESTLCILIFLIQYYFAIASHIWWLVLTLTWYLAASRKWGLEAINSIACYFHLFAWAVPAILTIAILVTGKVDANELTGMCYVGNHDKWALLIYVIIPISFLLFIGEIFLLAGFIALLKIRTNLKSQSDDSNIRKLEKLMAKIGVFAIIYTVAAVCILGSYIHESLNIETWRCMSASLTDFASSPQSIPTVEIQMLKIAMSFIIGISLSMWVLNSKTIKSYEKKCCRRHRNTSRLRSYKHSSYVIAKPSDTNGYVQHYKFPSRHNVIGSHYSQSTVSRLEAANI